MYVYISTLVQYFVLIDITHRLKRSKIEEELRRITDRNDNPIQCRRH